MARCRCREGFCLLLDLREKLDGRLLVGDGAMGTLLAERGVGYGHPYDRANLTHPQVVRAVHEEYVRAGARVIETNTFSANATKLALKNLGDQAWEINVEGARLARSAVENALSAGEDAIVLGAVGPL